MGIRNPKRNELPRLQCKTLDGQFENILTDGLNCSPFEAKAVVQAVKEVYFPFLDEAASSAPPGKITLLTVSAEEPSGKPIAECAKQAVCLTLHRGDGSLPAGVQPGRLADPRGPRLSHLLRRPRTISRDLAWVRQNHPHVPLPLLARCMTSDHC